MRRPLAFARRLLPLLTTLSLLVSAALSHAADPADVENPRVARREWVADMAGVLTPEARVEINAICDSLAAGNGAELAVVTVPDVGQRTPKEFATSLFNLWGIGKKGHDNGALMLVAVGNRRVELETGYGAESVLPDGRVGRILRQFVVPRFKEGDLSGGTLAGAREFARVLATAEPEAAAPVEHLVQPFGGGARARSASWPVPVASALTLLLGGGVLAFLRRRIRHCSKCGRRMRLLDDAQEKAYLGPDELLEERLRSMNYRVWRCDACQACHIEHEVRFWSRYTACPKCSRRTLARDSHVITAATHSRAGSREVTETCKRSDCGYSRVHTERIPKLESSSSSSGSSFSSSSSSGGGSFGGGSSGGGGSGASW